MTASKLAIGIAEVTIAAGVLCGSSAMGQSLGLMKLPSSVPQYLSVGYGPGRHAPLVKVPGQEPPRVPKHTISPGYSPQAPYAPITCGGYGSGYNATFPTGCQGCRGPSQLQPELNYPVEQPVLGEPAMIPQSEPMMGPPAARATGGNPTAGPVARFIRRPLSATQSEERVAERFFWPQ